MVSKDRWSVLFGASTDLKTLLDYNDTHIIVKGSNQRIQRRIDFHDLTYDRLCNQTFRLTWKHDINDMCDAITPQLSNGLNIYVPDSCNSMNFVETPLFHIFHSDVFDRDMIHKWLPRSITLDKKKDYDISVIGRDIRVNEYYMLEDNSIVNISKDNYEKVEAGFFYVGMSDDRNINMDGILCNWGDTSNINKCQQTTLFYEPAHFNSLKTTPIDIEVPVGLHPLLKIDLRNHKYVEKCEYFVYIHLPREIFVDKFQTSPIFVFGEDNLELPEYKLRNISWGSEIIYKLVGEEMNEIILHSRYAEPVSGGGYLEVPIYPHVFQACDTGSELVSENPFYSKGMGYEAYFTPDTIFNHLNQTRIMITIPRIDIDSFASVQYATLICILISIYYLFICIFKKYHE